MATPWTPELRAKFGPELMNAVGALRTATSVEQVHDIVRPYDLTDDEVAVVYEMAALEPVGPMFAPRDPKVGRVKFYASAWYVGCAYRQIARVLGISHQTVHASAGRMLGMNPQRVRDQLVTDEQCAAMYAIYQMHWTDSVEYLTGAFSQMLDSWDTNTIGG